MKGLVDVIGDLADLRFIVTILLVGGLLFTLVMSPDKLMAAKELVMPLAILAMGWLFPTLKSKNGNGGNGEGTNP
jgi:hypothetical protein